MGWLNKLIRVMMGVVPPHPSVRPTLPRPKPSPTSYDKDLTALINHERTARGLGAMTVDPTAMLIADTWAKRMASENLQPSRFHDGFRERMDLLGPNMGGSENCAAGTASALETMNSWMSSEGHKKNILGRYNAFGWGYGDGPSGRYWCVIFLSRPNATRPSQEASRSSVV